MEHLNEYEYVQDSQQATQIATQNEAAAIALGLDSHLFGCLQPCNAGAKTLVRIDFLKTHPTYAFGRGADNDIRLPGMKISNSHCILGWNQKDDHTATVTIRDMSTNGTFINNEKIGRGKSKVLRDGNEVAFGTFVAQAGEEDYRFIYRQLLGNATVAGVHAKYDLTHELGKGSFATVVKALKRDDGKYYAVKIIHGSKVRGDSDKREAAFAREISILQKLNHPNICQLIERFHNPRDENIYVVLEYVDGGDLLDYIVQRNRLSEGLSRHLTRQMCDALAYVHSQGITHRDLKPENVLLTSSNPPNVKVADFGLAKIVDHLTMLRTMCGTPNYLAPEVVNPGATGYDQLVDSWSVGVIVFCMLTGLGPFLEDEDMELQERIRTRTIDWSALRQQNVSNNAFDFIRRLLEVNPATRMTLAAALHHPWLNGEFDVPMADEPGDSQHSNAASALSEDVSMLSSLPSEIDIDIPASQPQPQPGPRARLERRSVILAREAAAAQEAAEPPVPSPEADTPDARTKRGRNGAAKMEPIGEEEPMAQDEDADADALPVLKKGRMDVDGHEEVEPPAPARGKKGAAKAPASTGKRATRAAAALAGEEEVRRSPRTAGKARR